MVANRMTSVGSDHGIHALILLFDRLSASGTSTPPESGMPNAGPRSLANSFSILDPFPFHEPVQLPEADCDLLQVLELLVLVPHRIHVDVGLQAHIGRFGYLKNRKYSIKRKRLVAAGWG